MKAHIAVLTSIIQPIVQAAPEAYSGTSADEVAMNVLSILGSGSEPLMVDDYEAPPDFHEELKEFLDDQPFVLQFMAVHAGRKIDAPVMMQPAVINMSSIIGAELPSLQERHGQGLRGRMDLDKVLECVGPHIYNVYNERWAQFGSKLIKVCASEIAGSSDSAANRQTIDSVSAGIFSEWADIDKVFKRRSDVVLSFVEKLMCGDDRITKIDFTKNHDALVQAADTLVSCELKVPLRNFASFWDVLLTSEAASVKQVLMQGVKNTASPTVTKIETAAPAAAMHGGGGDGIAVEQPREMLALTERPLER